VIAFFRPLAGRLPQALRPRQAARDGSLDEDTAALWGFIDYPAVTAMIKSVNQTLKFITKIIELESIELQELIEIITFASFAPRV
jgi:hypothetical protein